MNVNEAVARILKIEGVDWVSCFPSNLLIEAVAKEGIRTVMFRQERGALMAADGYSRMYDRQRFGVTITQGGPGSENSMGGIAQAFSDNVPILYLPGGPALNQYAVRPNFSPGPHLPDGLQVGRSHYPAVSGRGSHAARLPQPSQRAARPGNSGNPRRRGRPGNPRRRSQLPAAQEVRPSPSSGDVKEAVKVLLGARKPVIWSGMGVLFAGATEELRELAELTEIPVYCTMPGKSSFDERHPLALGAGSSSTTLPARRWLQESDVLFAVGSSMTRTSYGQPIPNGKLIIHNAESIEDLNKDFSVDVGIPGDAKLALQAMIEEVKAQAGDNGRKGQTSVAKEIAELREQWMSEWNAILNSDDVPINTYRVIGELKANLDLENSIVTHDAGAPRDTIMPFYPGTVPHSYIGWGKTTHLGYGIPLMIGAKLAKPDKFCLNFMGDGAFGMSGLDIETSVRAGAPITTIVLNNGGMATYPGGYPTAADLFGATHMTGDYSKIAEGMGAVGITVTQPSEVGPALKRAQQLNADGRTVLLDIHTNLEARRSNFS